MFIWLKMSVSAWLSPQLNSFTHKPWAATLVVECWPFRLMLRQQRSGNLALPAKSSLAWATRYLLDEETGDGLFRCPAIFQDPY
jgi:hypothetical protein